MAERWTQWKTRLPYYIDARELPTTIVNEPCSILHLAGPAVQDILSTLTDTGTTYAEALTIVDAYFTPQKNLQLERHSILSSSASTSK